MRAAERTRRELLRDLDDRIRRLPIADRHPVACEPGCDFCCHLRVMVTPVEVFGLLDFIDARFTDAERSAFRQRLGEAAAAIRAVPAEQLLATNIACPVLVEGRCSAYAARPFNCRSYHSLDRSACERAFDNPENRSLEHPQYANLARTHVLVQRDLVRKVEEGGRDSTQVELVTALEEAASDPGARTRWERGERLVFRTAAEVLT